MDRNDHHPNRRRLDRDRGGAVLVEFALVLPLLAMLLLGILGYGQYFLLAHEVQQVANDAARSAIGGLNAKERATIAQASVVASAAAGSIDQRQVTATIAETDPLLTVTVRFDARQSILLNIGLLPVPDRVIERRAVVRLGGGV